MAVKRRLKGFRRRLRGKRAENDLFYELVHAVFAADFLFGQRGFEQGVVLRQGVAFGFVVPEVVGDAGEFEVVAFHAVMEEAGDELAVFAPPADKAVVEAVDGERIAAEKAHIAGFDAFVFAAALSADQGGQAAAAQGGQAFFYALAEHGQIGQFAGI